MILLLRLVGKILNLLGQFFQFLEPLLLRLTRLTLFLGLFYFDSLLRLLRLLFFVVITVVWHLDLLHDWSRSFFVIYHKRAVNLGALDELGCASQFEPLSNLWQVHHLAHVNRDTACLRPRLGPILVKSDFKLADLGLVAVPRLVPIEA